MNANNTIEKAVAEQLGALALENMKLRITVTALQQELTELKDYIGQLPPTYAPIPSLPSAS